MSLKYIRLYPQDYLQDTNHLTTEEHGAYLLLILNYWQTEYPLKDDDKRLAGICRTSAERWSSIRLTVAEFFEVEDGLWRHKRIEAELFLVDKKSEQARKAGKIGGLIKAKNQLLTSERQASAKRPSSDTDTDTNTNTLKEKKGKPRPQKEQILYPDWLDQEAWGEWIQHRKEIKSPMTALAEKKCMNKLQTMLNGVTQRQIVDHCIANGWKGLFPPDKERQGVGNKSAASTHMDTLKEIYSENQ